MSEVSWLLGQYRWCRYWVRRKRTLFLWHTFGVGDRREHDSGSNYNMYASNGMRYLAERRESERAKKGLLSWNEVVRRKKVR